MTETPFGVLVGRLAQADPGRPAVTCDAVTISRAELEARTNRLARVYRAQQPLDLSVFSASPPRGTSFAPAATPR
jgi:bile acid-coenzyme A ligase